MIEFGVYGPDFAICVLIYLILCFCIIIPNQACQSAEFTIPQIFYSYICEERFNFIEHHLRRSTLTMFIHACLPFMFCVILEYALPQKIFIVHPKYVIQYFAHATILFAMGVMAWLYYIRRDNWARHSITEKLKKINVNYQRVMDSINSEYRSYDNFKIQYSGYFRIMVTDSWILIIRNYTVDFVKTSDALFKVVQVAEHPLFTQDQSGFQLVDIEIESISKKFSSFKIRVTTQEMLDDLERKLNRRIDFLHGINISASLYERFVKAFLEKVQENPTFICPNKEELENCLGCSLSISNVKIARTCDDSTNPEIQTCGICRCRPMWCGSCMARVFASKQDKKQPEIWMSGKAACPTCRTVFCLLDVCPLE